MSARGDVDVLLDLRGRNSDALRAIAGTRSALSMLTNTQRRHAVGTRAYAKETATLNRLLADQHRHLQTLSLDYVAVRRAVLSMGIRGAVTGFASLTSAVDAAGVAAVSTAGSLTAAGGAAASAGSQAAVAGAQGFMVLKTALDGIGKAMTTSGQAHEQALDKLTGTQRKFVGNLRDVQMELRHLRQLAQDGALPGIEKGIRNAMPLMDDLKQAVHDTAEVWGYLAERAGAVIADHEVEVRRMMQRNVVWLRRGGDSVIELGEAWIVAQEKMSGMLDDISIDVANFSRNTRKHMEKADLESTAYRWNRAWKAWTSTVGNVGKTVWNIFDAAEPTIARTERAIADAAESMDEWSSSAEGQKKVRDHFRTMEPVMESIAKAVGATALSLGRISEDGAGNATRIFDGWRTDVLPIIETFAKSMNDHLLPQLIDLGDEVTDLLEAVQPGLEDISAVVGGLISATADALDMLGDVAGTIDTVFDFGGRDVGSMLAALAVPAAVIGSWTLFKTTIQRAVLATRLAASGKTIQDFAGTTGPGGSRAGGPALAVGVGGFGGGYGPSASGGVPRVARHPGRTVRNVTVPGASYRVGHMGAVHPSVGSVGAVAPYGASSALTYRPGIIPGLASPVSTPYGTRYRTSGRAGHFIPRPGIAAVSMPVGGFGGGTTTRMRNTATGRLMASRYVMPGGASPTNSGAMARYQRQLASMNRPIPLTRGERIGARMAPMTAPIAQSMHKGMVAGGNSAIKALKSPLATGLFGASFISGVIGAASTKGGFQDRLKGAMSAASFGLIPTADEDRDKKAAEIERDIRTGGKNIGLKVAGADGNAQAGLNAYIEIMRRNKSITEEQAKALQDLNREYGVLRANAGKLKQAIGESIDINDFNPGIKGIENMLTSFKDLEPGAAGSLGELRRAVRRNADLIGQTFKEGSDGWTKHTTRAFGAQLESVQNLMARKLISVKKGEAEIRKIWAKNLELYGFSPDQVRNQAAGNRLDGGAEEGTRGPNAARGALRKIGSHGGAAGPDTVPVNVMAGRGEDVAIINRHQRAALDERLADTGGLAGFMSRKWPKHSAPGFARGGIVSLGKRLQKQGYNVAEHPAFGGVAPVHKGRAHYEGNAIDVNVIPPGPGDSLEAQRFDKLAPRLTQQGWKVLWRVAGHAPGDNSHMHIEGTEGGLGVGGGAKWKRVRADKNLPPYQRKQAQTVINDMRAAAKANFDRQTGGITLDTGIGNPLDGARGKLSREAIASLMRSAGFPEGEIKRGVAIALAESGGDPRIQNSIGATGLWQILLSAHPGVSASEARDPVAATRYAKKLWDERGWQPWEAYTNGAYVNYLAAAGLLAQTSTTNSTPKPSRQDGVPAYRPGDEPRGDNKKKKGKKPKKPIAKLPSYPTLKGIKGKIKQTIKPRKIRAGAKKLMRPFRIGDERLEGIFSWHDMMDKSLGTWGDLEQTLTARHALTEFSPFITTDASGNQVINWEGGKDVNDGKFYYGINHEVAELNELLNTVKRPYKNALELFEQNLGTWHPELEAAIREREERARFIQNWIDHNVIERREDEKDLRKEQKKPGSWQQRVADNRSKIKRLQDWKRDVRRAKIGHRLTDEQQEALVKADQDIADLTSENARLSTDKPKPKQADHKRMGRLSRAISLYGRENAALTDFRNDIESDLPGYRENRQAFSDRIGSLRTNEIPQAQIQIESVENLIRDLQGTIQPPTTKGTDTALSELDKGLLLQELTRLRTENFQINALRDFGQMVGMRTLGSFAHGAVRIPETGMALVHKNETIVPDPNGPFRNGMTMNRLGGGDGRLTVELVVREDRGAITQIVDARVVDRAQGSASRGTGQRTRLIRAAG